MKKDIRKFLNFSNILADEARLISLKYFKRKMKIKNKNRCSFDPVTVADIKIQKTTNKALTPSVRSISMTDFYAICLYQ